MKNFLKLSLFFFATLGTLIANAATHQNYGGQSMVAPLQKVLVKRPDNAYANADPKIWHYTAKPDLKNAQREHDAFVNLLKQNDIQVFYHNEYLPTLADAIYVHDPVIITNQGAIILRMGKDLRRGEEEAIEKKLNQLGIPTFFKLEGEATAEGGDTLWVDERTLAVGHSFRTNQAGIKQLRDGLSKIGVEVIEVQLPYDQGKEACLHLQSLISLVDYRKAVVYKKLMPVSFVQYLEKKGFKLIDVDDDEYLTMGPNILTLKPNLVLTIKGNHKIKRNLEENGVRVLTYEGDDISLKAEGGATCLTRPILRGPMRETFSI